MGVKIIETNLKRTFWNFRIKKPHQHYVFAVSLWSGTELNRRHEDFQSSALPTELPDLHFQSLVKREYKVTDYTSIFQKKNLRFKKII